MATTATRMAVTSRNPRCTSDSARADNSASIGVLTLRLNFGDAPSIELIPPALESFVADVARRPELPLEARVVAPLLVAPLLLFAVALLFAALDSAALLRVAGLVDEACPERLVRPRATLEAAALEFKGNPVLTKE